MADDTSIRTGIDRSRINLSQPHEVTYWTRELGCTAEQLEAAVRAVGPSVVAVRQRLGSGSDYKAPRR